MGLAENALFSLAFCFALISRISLLLSVRLSCPLAPCYKRNNPFSKVMLSPTSGDHICVSHHISFLIQAIPEHWFWLDFSAAQAEWPK